MIRILPAVLFIWFGLLLAVSFVATPAKFLAPSLPMAQALDVGRWTFHVLTLIEWALIALVGLLVLISRRHVTGGWGLVMGLLIAIAAVLAVETFLVRPILDARVLDILAGRNVAPSGLHALYVVLDAFQLVLILAAAITSSRWTPAASAHAMGGRGVAP